MNGVLLLNQLSIECQNVRIHSFSTAHSCNTTETGIPKIKRQSALQYSIAIIFLCCVLQNGNVDVTE